MNAQCYMTSDPTPGYYAYDAPVVEKTFLMPATALSGEVVVNGAGETLGRIDSIMLDMTTGRIAYAVLSVGGFLGIGDKLFAIPWEALNMDLERDHFVLHADRELFKNSPGFDKHRWPAMPDSEVIAALSASRELVIA